ncbi:MAG: hypothetical protein U5R48_01270 [Gammaproteobacteria bacterium]|nr:hypothetical protein [Gammaproteobacteria bacterium]
MPIEMRRERCWACTAGRPHHSSGMNFDCRSAAYGEHQVVASTADGDQQGRLRDFERRR